eukprot:TRINITY_DN283_c0_g1_i1.p1 TRINITY_DN283_c0_g1~~TRINITY_DN283_c0_g1_i1.p1  ORF type:complete len:308 (-),score=56.55 TRINITY_DN283_c0_g1_i1:34-957(-)
MQADLQSAQEPMGSSNNEQSENNADIADVVKTQDITADDEVQERKKKKKTSRFLSVQGMSADEFLRQFKQFGKIEDVSQRPTHTVLMFETSTSASKALLLNGWKLRGTAIKLKKTYLKPMEKTKFSKTINIKKKDKNTRRGQETKFKQWKSLHSTNTRRGQETKFKKWKWVRVDSSVKTQDTERKTSKFPPVEMLKLRGVSADEFQNHFKQFGRIRDAGHPTKTVLKFESPEFALKAFRLNGTMLNGKTIELKRTKKKELRQTKLPKTINIKQEGKKTTRGHRGGKRHRNKRAALKDAVALEVSTPA